MKMSNCSTKPQPNTVSAVIPTFNRRAYLRRAIDSILAQIVPVDEIIVVDDGSSDGSAELVHDCYGGLVRLIRQSNLGVSGARYRGIREARGEWIAFLDSDDEWMPERNGQLLQAAARVPSGVGWIFGDLRMVTDSGERATLFEEYGLKVHEHPHIFSDSLAIQYPFQFPMLQGSFIRRTALLELNCFSEGLRSDDDLLASYQVACRYKVAGVPSVVGRYFRTSDLAASSVVVNGVFGKDYYRSRMIAFETVIKTGRRRPWNARYAGCVRGYCQVLARKGIFMPQLAWQQFRYGAVSPKGVAFLCAAIFGPRALQIWDKIAAFRRQYLGNANSAPVRPKMSEPDNGTQASRSLALEHEK